MTARFKNYRTSIKEIVYYVSDKATCRFHIALKQTLNKESPMMRITATSEPEPKWMKCSFKTNNTTLCINTDTDVPGSTNSAVIIILTYPSCTSPNRYMWISHAHTGSPGLRSSYRLDKQIAQYKICLFRGRIAQEKYPAFMESLETTLHQWSKCFWRRYNAA
jgi:hypothetical protein